MATTSILYSVAKDKSGNVINATDADKQHAYYCLSCSGELVLKKSGKTGPRCKRPHFAHKVVALDCSPESVLHFEFKNRAFRLLQDYLKRNNPLPLSWECDFCRDRHTGNLLRRANQVELEYDLREVRPDIALVDTLGRVYAVIEVVVTHEPGENALEYYRKNDIHVVEVHLKSDLDLGKVELKLARPTHVGFCPNPQCEFCNHHMNKVSLVIIIDARCWRCGDPVKLAVLRAVSSVHGNATFYLGVDDAHSLNFNKEEVELAKQMGVVLTPDKGDTFLTWGEKRSTCTTCKAPVGAHYLGDYLKDAYAGKLEYKITDASYECVNHDCPLW